ncbi:hypothetical protein [Antarctobacter jejuensis]|uniref:hypothetical protein n=1 Tax=Antarctobacter jejuensis TaxID=1439938 RepID=UPI003FD11C34
MLSSVKSTFLGAVCATLVGSGAAFAADPVEQYNSSAFWFINWIGLSNATLDVVAPSGEMQTIFAASGTPVYELDRATATDGVYRYELSAATDKQVKIINPQNNGRGDNASDMAAESFYMTGQFVVSRGVITVPDEMIEEEN